ncbi:hypothetical protein MuYL_4011 [Mucilaginibacter xinganensis]|uniref:Uncharacterized protein n=1 Tax=Mucilaginibacter xinganensis TaxID=1234841 RepID=A0A223P1D2_9SPHI|nr:hypothetical protein MuYL_4011 [Mucilaginibacter xinganensis]
MLGLCLFRERLASMYYCGFSLSFGGKKTIFNQSVTNRYFIAYYKK